MPRLNNYQSLMQGFQIGQMLHPLATAMQGWQNDNIANQLMQQSEIPGAPRAQAVGPNAAGVQAQADATMKQMNDLDRSGVDGLKLKLAMEKAMADRGYQAAQLGHLQSETDLNRARIANGGQLGSATRPAEYFQSIAAMHDREPAMAAYKAQMTGWNQQMGKYQTQLQKMQADAVKTEAGLSGVLSSKYGIDDPSIFGMPSTKAKVGGHWWGGANEVMQIQHPTKGVINIDPADYTDLAKTWGELQAKKRAISAFVPPQQPTMPTFGAQSPAAGPATGGTPAAMPGTQQSAAALQWARSNPTDPRAMKIMQLLGQ